MLKAHKITTVYYLNGISKMFIGKYIVIADTTPKAVSLVPLREREEVVQASEMAGYQVIVEAKNEQPQSH